MKPLKNIVSALLMPLLYLNLAALAAGAIWLGMTGQWQVIWLGILMIFFSPYIIPVLLMPAGIFSHFMIVYQNAGQRQKEQRMFFLSLAYILLFMTMLCVGVFVYVTTRVHPAVLGAALLWGSACALTPLLLWSSRDRQNIFIMTMVEVAQLSILVLCALSLSGIMLSFWPAFAVFGGLMAMAAAAQAFYEKRLDTQPR